MLRISLIRLFVVSCLLVLLSCNNENNKKTQDVLAESDDSENNEIIDLRTTALLADYEILDMEKGILNSDELEDLIVVYKKISEGDEDERILGIYFAYGEGYNLHAINFAAIGSRFCGGIFGDCYNGIDIKDGYFSINYYGGSGNNKWLQNSTFKYDDKNGEFYLYRVSEAGSKTIGIEMDHKEADSFVTADQFGSVKFEEYNYYIDYFAENNHKAITE